MRTIFAVACLNALYVLACAGPAVAEEWPVGAPPLRVAVGPLSPPLFDLGPDGTPRGFVVDYLTEAAHRAHVPIEFTPIPDRRAFESMDPAQHPLALWLLADEPFSGYVRFERGFLTLHSAVFRRTERIGEGELEAADLGEVIVVRGSEAHQDLLDDGALDLVAMPTTEEAVRLLASGQHDTLFGTDFPVLQAIRDLDIRNVEIAPSVEMHMHHRFALLRAISRPDVEAHLSPSLRDMRHDGSFDRLYAKWFGPLQAREVPLRVLGFTVTSVIILAVLLGLVVVPLSRRRLRALLSWQGKALEESEARIAAIMAASPTGIFRLDLDGAVTFGNQEAARITGIHDGPVNAQRWLHAIHPDDRASVAAAWRAVRTENISDHREYRFVHPDGEVVWVLDRGHPELDSAGQVAGFVGTLTDITQIKHHETSYRTHSKVLMSMTEGVNTTDIHGTILYTNAAFDEMFGYGPGELVGKNVSTLNHVSQQEFDRHSDAIKEALLTQGFWAGEFRNRRKDGTEFWTRARISRLEGAGDAFGVCVQEDITEAKHAQKALRESEEKFRRVAESALVGIALTDEGEFIFSNEAMINLVGYSPEDMRGLGRAAVARLLLGEHPNPSVLEALINLDRVDGSEPVTIEEARIQHKDGTDRWARLTISRLFPDRPFPRMFVCMDITARKRAETALLESEEKFRSVAESAMVGIAIFDGTKYSYANRAMMQLFGYESLAEIGSFAREDIASLFFRGPDRGRVLQALQQVDSQDNSTEPVVLEDVSVQHKEGKPRWAYIMFSRLYPNRLYPRLIVCVDTTERKLAEEAVAKHQDMLRRTQQMARIGGWEYVLATNEVQCSEEVRRIYGVGPGDPVTWDLLLSRFAPEDQALIHERGVRAVTAMAPFNFEAELTNLRGERLWVHTSAEPVVENGAVVRVVGAAQDISDLKRVENSLRESEALFRGLSEQMPDALLLLDLDDTEAPGRIIYANAAAARMHGMTEAEILGRPIASLDAPDTARQVHNRIARLRAGETVYFEGEHVRKDGTVFPVDVVARRIDALGGNKILAIDRDITERRKVEAERRILEEQMQQTQRLESLAVLAGGIAHDFNNLLAGILGHTDLAREDVPPGNPARESIEQIDVAARRAADLVHQMLAYAGKGNLVIRRVHLGELVREIAKLLEVTLSKKATLRYELDETVPPIEGDAVQLQQVVMNLITNASDALGGDSGTITLRSGVVDYCEDALRAYTPHEPPKPGSFVFLEVSDTGCGMDAATLNRIFEPFFTTKFTGRGLGLAATLGIIRGHGGGLRVTSREGGGTTFRIILPVAAEAGPGRSHPVGNGAESAESSADRRAGAILVVDDEPRVRDFLVRALQRFGHEVYSAADGQQALDLFQRNTARITAVLLDITMPGIGGEQVLAALHAQRPDLPVLLMSGFSEAETRQRLQHNGYTGFLQKPFSIDALRQSVEGLFAAP